MVNHPTSYIMLIVICCESFQDQITYQLTGTDSAKQAFFVNPDTGLVSLKKSLTETAEETFMVRNNL